MNCPTIDISEHVRPVSETRDRTGSPRGWATIGKWKEIPEIRAGSGPCPIHAKPQFQTISTQIPGPTPLRLSFCFDGFRAVRPWNTIFEKKIPRSRAQTPLSKLLLILNMLNYKREALVIQYFYSWTQVLTISTSLLLLNILNYKRVALVIWYFFS